MITSVALVTLVALGNTGNTSNTSSTTCTQDLTTCKQALDLSLDQLEAWKLRATAVENHTIHLNKRMQAIEELCDTPIVEERTPAWTYWVVGGSLTIGVAGALVGIVAAIQ